MSKQWECWLNETLTHSGKTEHLIHIKSNKWQDSQLNRITLNDDDHEIHERLMHTLRWCKENQRAHEFSCAVFTHNSQIISLCIYNFVVAPINAQQWRVSITKTDNNQLLDATDLFDNPLLNSLDDAVVLTDTRPVSSGGPRIITTNAASNKMTGYAQRELIGRSPNMLQGSQGKNPETQRIKRAIMAWQPVVATVKNFRKDGTAFYVELNIVPFKDKSGWYSHWISVQRDLSSRIEQAAMVKQRELLLTSPHIGCWSFDVGSAHLNLDKKTQEMHLLKNAYSCPIATLFTHVKEPERASLVQRFSSALKQGDSISIEYPIEKDEKIKWVLTKAHQAESVNHTAVISGISFDITQQKRTSAVIGEYRAHAEQRNRLASIGELSAGVGHEINNPLSIITSTVDYLRLIGSCSPDYHNEVRKCLDDISQASERIERIVYGLKSISLGARSPDKLSRVNLVQCCLPTLEMTQQLFTNEGIVLNVDWPEDQDGYWVLAEASGIQQVLVNLLNNSRDALESSDDKTITVSFSRGEKSASLIVRDTGMGISAEMLERIFEPFVTTKLVSQGTGLGLSISKNIISSFGGNLHCRSEENKATEFFCELPMASEDINASSSGESEKEKRTAVLIVEDEEMLANAIKRLFEFNGCYCDIALNGKAALEVLKRNHFDIILSDLKMPELDGFELLERVSQDTRFLHVKKFAMTGEPLTDNDSKVHELAKKTLAIFQKPLKLIDIVKMNDIAKMMDR